MAVPQEESRVDSGSQNPWPITVLLPPPHRIAAAFHKAISKINSPRVLGRSFPVLQICRCYVRIYNSIYWLWVPVQTAPWE